MTTYRNTPIVEDLYEVRFQSGSVRTYTESQLEENPQLRPYARRVQSGDVLALDYADADGSRRDPGRLPASSRRYYMPDAPAHTTFEMQPQTLRRPAVPPRASATQTAAPPAPAKRRKVFGRLSFRAHPVLWVGILMFVMILGWIAFNALSNWWQVQQDDWHYGRPRTAQYDVVVGHNDDPAHLTHIIAENLHSRVIIIELPGGETSKARIYTGPTLFGPNADLAPVTLTFSDPTNSGHPEMLVHVQDAIIIYLNQRINGVWQFTPQQSQ